MKRCHFEHTANSITAYCSFMYNYYKLLFWALQAKDDNSELELASIEQQRADEDVRKLLDDQKVCAFLFYLAF
jgi:hypothetical protein